MTVALRQLVLAGALLHCGIAGLAAGQASTAPAADVVSAPTPDPESSATFRAGKGQQLGVTAVSIDGVCVGELVAGVTSARMLSWHQIKSINGDLAAGSQPLLANADAAWRGLARLERGDELGAEAILEPLAKTYRLRGGPTAAAVYAGLLRCRLGRGAQTLAIDAWAGWLAANEIAPDAGGGPAVSSWDRAEELLVGVIDSATGLATALPPAWLNVPAVRSLAGADAMPTEPGPSRGEQMRDLYVQAARFECRLPTRLRPMDQAWSESQRLVWQIVAARIGDEATRKEARAALQGRLRVAIPAWQEAWCRVGIGRSLLLESDDDSKRDGLLHLLAIASREDGSDVYLTGIALAEAAASLRARGDSAGSNLVLADLVRQYPDHPAMEWELIRPYVRGAGASTWVKPVDGETKNETNGTDKSR
jgi:hypothetical protein